MAEDQLKLVKSRLQPFPVIHLGNRQHPTNYGWAMAFVYAPSGNYVVTGETSKVEAYIKECWGCCLFYLSLWGETFQVLSPPKSRWPGKQKTNHRGHWSTRGIELVEKVAPKSKKTKANYEKLGMKDSGDERNAYFFAGAPASARFRIGLRHAEPTACFFYRRLPKKWLPEWTEMVLNG
jgi:hypothetical protein